VLHGLDRRQLVVLVRHRAALVDGERLELGAPGLLAPLRELGVDLARDLLG
jgi:hypothetical protein